MEFLEEVVKCVEIRRTPGGEGVSLTVTDVGGSKKRGEQTGLIPCVVHAVNR